MSVFSLTTQRDNSHVSVSVAASPHRFTSIHIPFHLTPFLHSCVSVTVDSRLIRTTRSTQQAGNLVQFSCIEKSQYGKEEEAAFLISLKGIHVSRRKQHRKVKTGGKKGIDAVFCREALTLAVRVYSLLLSLSPFLARCSSKFWVRGHSADFSKFVLTTSCALLTQTRTETISAWRGKSLNPIHSHIGSAVRTLLSWSRGWFMRRPLAAMNF